MLATAWALKVDRVTADVVAAFDEAGIPSVLLKGPAVQRSLYADGTVRSYTDCDLLVPADQAGRAASVLLALGFDDRSLSGIAGDRPLHARTFVRPADGAHADLHTTVIGASAPERDVWNAIYSTSEDARVGGRVVRVPSRPGLAVHVALHAAQHGVQEQRPLEDLRRAVRLFDRETWEEAATVAAAMGATTAFAAGLRLVPEGADLLPRLGLEEVRPDPYVRLRAASAPHLASGFAWLEGDRLLRSKARLVAAKLFPPPRFMRAWTPLARRGPLGLVLSYPWRLLWILWHAPAGFRAWRRAKG